jgi:hypothetical protein
MRRISFAIAVLVVAIGVISLFETSSGNRKEPQQAGKGAEISVKLSSQIAWDSGIRFAMRWDDARKKMIFDRRMTRVVSFLGRWTDPFSDVIRENRIDDGISSLAGQDKYSFDAGNITDPGDSSNSAKQAGQIHFGVNWNNTRKQPPSPSLARYDFINETFKRQVYVLWSAHNAEGGPASLTER